MEGVTAVLFVKEHSERIPGKNFRDFNGTPLYKVILEKLNSHPLVAQIVVDSDSEEILKYVDVLPKGAAVERPSHLRGEHIAANELLQHDLSFAKTEHIFQTHVTNPLLETGTITRAIEKYFSLLPARDSLFAVTRIQKRVFGADGTPINHEAGRLLRTQDLKPVFEENSGFFLFSKSSFSACGNSRIGRHPFLFEISAVEAIDIDYEHEFKLAELVARNKNSFPQIFSGS